MPPFANRIPAPSLDGGVAWINTAGPIELKQLRGKFVLLDFWTYCCINCMHILPELKKLERAYPNEIVVIGVHSAKFEAEQDSDNITEAVLRYEIEHPIINDANHVVWDKFEVQSWPSLRVIDPEGYFVAGHSGEITFEALNEFFRKFLPYYKDKGLLDESPVHFTLARDSAADTPLRFPGKVLADEPGNRLFISDSNHNRIVVTTLDGKLLETIGSGAIGRADGGFAQCSFDHPQGTALHGDKLYIADNENHMLRVADLTTKQVRTVAGTGKQAHDPFPGADQAVRGQTPHERFVGPPRTTELSSPWALWIHEDTLYIAMAGPHQIWRMPLDEKEIGPHAGNGREDIVDGPLLPREPFAPGSASFAQPSGLASDGKWLYVADSEGSSIRAVPFEMGKKVRTIVGTAHKRMARLFTFGDQDGKGNEVLLQHPLDVLWHDGKIYVADTYNSKIKVIDPEEHITTTLATTLNTAAAGEGDATKVFDEPAGLAYAAGKLYVADTNGHRIQVVELDQGNRVRTLEIEGLTPPAPAPITSTGRGIPVAPLSVPATKLAVGDGKVRLDVEIKLAEGWKINALAPTAYTVESQQPAGPVDRSALGKRTRLDPPAQKFKIELPTTTTTGSETLKVSLDYYYCQEGSEGLCKMGKVAWNVPIELTASGGQAAVKLEVEAK